MESLVGKFLVSEAELIDPNFKETLVLIVSHDKQGAFGLVVNRQSNLLLSSALPDIFGELETENYIYIGGPVEQEYLFFLHNGIPIEYRSEHCLQINSKIFFEPDFSKIRKFLTVNGDNISEVSRKYQIHFFAGYSGWAPGQLEEEIKEKAWTTIESDEELVFFTNPEQTWKKALKKKGGVYWVLAETGEKPSLN